MKRNIIKSLAALIMGAMLLTGCGKDDKDALIGKWVNTAQSYEITIAGQEYLPEGFICMAFTSDSVWIFDYRIDCLPTWHGYTFSEESGKRLLTVQGGCFDGMVFVVEKLTSDELVLTPTSVEIDWSFRYIMKRHETSEWPD